MRRSSIVTMACALAVTACMQAPDLSAVRETRARSVQRYDVIQSLAANDKVLVAGTQQGVLLRSADGGRTWERQVLGPKASLIGFATCPDGSFVGIDFYGTVWFAGASGEEWKARPIEKPETPLAVACDRQNRAWIAGSGATIASSADEGASWTVTDLGEDIQLTALQFPDEQFGIALGEFGTVVKTTDGGAQWVRAESIPDEFYPYAAVFVSREEGWVSGISGHILHTRDGGRTWAPQENSSRVALYRLVEHAGRVYGVGASGTVARLEGEVWRPLAYPDAVPVPLAAGAVVAADGTLVVGGPGGLLRTVSLANN